MTTNLATTFEPDFLAVDTMAEVEKFFQTETSHRPSAAMMAALRDVADTLASMARGTAEPKVYLSSLDPGVGKTTVIVKFLDQLLTGRYTQPGAIPGVLLCVARLDEIAAYVERSAIPKEMFAVLTSDPKMNALSDTPVNDAVVLFTTQQMMESRIDGGSFEGCQLFHYQDRPRPVRVWDETFTPGSSMTLDSWDFTNAGAAVLHRFPALAEHLRDFSVEMSRLRDGHKFTMPDLEQDFRLDLNDLLSAVGAARSCGEEKAKENTRENLTLLWMFNGRPVRIRRDGGHGNAFVTFRETISEDILPLLVTDASGRVRTTYTEMARGRGNLVRLKEPKKKYKDLSIGVWPIGGGKSSFESGAGVDKRALGIANTINQRPDEAWLVVYHKASGRVKDLSTRTKALLEQPDNVSWVTWGRHMATNKFAKVHNVILAGTLFYRDSQYESLGRRAANVKPEDGVYNKRRRQRIAAGEHRHGILQALCRGNARNLDGDQARPCWAYIIADPRNGIPGLLRSIFPGCRLEEWLPVRDELSGLPRKAADYLAAHFEDPKAKDLRFGEVARAIGCVPKNFKRDVRENGMFKQWLAEEGLLEWGNGVQPMFFTRATCLFK